MLCISYFFIIYGDLVIMNCMKLYFYIYMRYCYSGSMFDKDKKIYYKNNV